MLGPADCLVGVLVSITCLEYLASYAKYKIWIKPAGEMSFLYGNNVLKAHLGRITENTPKYQGVVFYNMADVPLGFGVSAFSTNECRKVEPTAVVAFHQADIGIFHSPFLAHEMISMMNETIFRHLN